MSKKEKISVSSIICTCNRAETLQRTLSGMSKLQIPDKFDFELLIVDNNSLDNTKMVVEEFQAECGIFPVRYVLEKRQGLSYARNRGIDESTGDYVIFWDDDAIPVPGYLRELGMAIERYPDVRAFGGRVIGVYENKPDWFVTEGPYRLLGALGSYDLGNRDTKLKSSDILPIGANMIFKKEVFEKYGIFRTDLGRKKGSKYILSFEDTEFYQRVGSAGESIIYLAHATVHHYVDTSRFEKRILRKWFIGSGIVLASLQAVNGKKILSVPIYILREMFDLTIKIIFYSIIQKHKIAYFYVTRFYIYLGMIKFFRRPEILKI